MTKKKYIAPIMEFEEIDPEPPFATSSTTGKPGHGWGDGGHTGPPGHNKHAIWQNDETKE